MHNHAPDGYICPFCRLAQGERGVYSGESDVVYQDDAVTAFISSHQWPGNPGNVIVIPNEHFENIYDLPVALAAKVHELAKAVALAMKTAWQCDGVSTRQHNEPAGGQDVWHFHLHVTPRFEGDMLYERYASHRVLMPAHERAAYATPLRKHVSRENPART